MVPGRRLDRLDVLECDALERQTGTACWEKFRGVASVRAKGRCLFWPSSSATHEFFWQSPEVLSAPVLVDTVSACQ